MYEISFYAFGPVLRCFSVLFCFNLLSLLSNSSFSVFTSGRLHLQSQAHHDFLCDFSIIFPLLNIPFPSVVRCILKVYFLHFYGLGIFVFCFFTLELFYPSTIFLFGMKLGLTQLVFLKELLIPSL